MNKRLPLFSREGEAQYLACSFCIVIVHDISSFCSQRLYLGGKYENVPRASFERRSPSKVCPKEVRSDAHAHAHVCAGTPHSQNAIKDVTMIEWAPMLQCQPFHLIH